MLAQLASWIIAAISATGYFGVAALMALESACIPVPSEVVMPFAGYLVSTGRLSLWLVALAGAIGCNIGSTAAYFVGARGGRAFIARWGRNVLVTTADLDQAERFFQRFGMAAVLIGRLLPVVRTFIALPAGIARMRQMPFQILTFAGSFVWCYVLAFIGQQLGERWNSDPRLNAVMHRFDFVILAMLVAGVAWFVWRRLRSVER